MSEAKIRIGANFTGTAWLVDVQHAITAAHCVGPEGSLVDLLFENATTHVYDQQVVAAVICRDGVRDGALLRLDEPQPNRPVFPVIGLADGVQPRWRARGFPAIAEDQVQIFEATGTIGARTTLYQLQNAPAVQINLDYANLAPVAKFDPVTGSTVHALEGMSGSAVKVDEGPARGRVFGLIRCSIPSMPTDVIYATPIDSIWPAFAPHFGNPPLQRLGRQYGVVCPDTADPQRIRSSIDAELVSLAWGENPGVTDIFVNYSWQEAGELGPAIARLVLHQPQIARLHVRGAELWFAQLRQAAKQWMVLETYPLDGLRNPCVELVAVTPVEGGTYSNRAAAACAIHQACDRWVLQKLNDRLGLLFVARQPRDYSPQFDIAPDVLAQMASTWQNWYTQLATDPQLLHHFLALVLTHHGNFEAATSCPGAGPLTFVDCIVRGVTFGLAVAPFLPTSLIPKVPQPGNIGAPAINGHVCGIRGIQNLKLDRALRNHAWCTHVVVLRELEELPEQWRVTTSSLAATAGIRRPSLDRSAPTSLVIACDNEFCDAIAVSADAIRAFLARRQQQLTEAQAEYIANSTS